MKSVIDQRHINDLQDRYYQLFYKKYGRAPNFSDQERKAFHAVYQRLGFEESIDLLTVYFTMSGDDGWFDKQAHSVQAFLGNLNKVIAKAGFLDKQIAQGRGIKLLCVNGYESGNECGGIYPPGGVCPKCG